MTFVTLNLFQGLLKCVRNVLPGDAEMILKQVQDGLTAMHSLRQRRSLFVDSEMQNIIFAPAEQPVSRIMICDVIRLPRWGKEPKSMYAFSTNRLPRWGMTMNNANYCRVVNNNRRETSFNFRFDQFLKLVFPYKLVNL